LIFSVGIEHHPPGLDPAWARIWFLDAAAHPVRPCRLVPQDCVDEPFRLAVGLGPQAEVLAAQEDRRHGNGTLGRDCPMNCGGARAA
jgi:hypothetical protein